MFSNSYHFFVVTGITSKSYIFASGIDNRNGECVAIINWHLKNLLNSLINCTNSIWNFGDKLFSGSSSKYNFPSCNSLSKKSKDV